MSPRTMVRLVGMAGVARLILGQARSHGEDGAAVSQLSGDSSAQPENASTT